MSHYHLAQLNIGALKAPLNSPMLRDFVENLDQINALADASPGFIWRLTTDEGNATALRPLGEDIIINMSVWQDVDSLHHYVYASGHGGFMRRRREWFERMADAYMVLWWVEADHHPSVQEALTRLELLKQHGPTQAAFTFRQMYPAPEP